MRSFTPLLLLLASCQTYAEPVRTVDNVDIDRFMGAWYVIGHIPTFITAEAYNAVERYRRGEGNKVEVLYTFSDGGFDGELEIMTPTGFIGDEDKAEWGMRLVWPLKADYRISYLNDDYTTTIIARNKRDYVWIMSRTPHMPDAEYQELVSQVIDMGYDVNELRRVPQQPLSVRPKMDFEGKW